MFPSETDHTVKKGVEMTQQHDRRDARGGLSRLRRPRLLPYAAALVVAFVSVASGSAARGPALAAPTSLQTFMKRIGDARKLSAGGIPTYSRTPSFAWAAVRGASHYEFELSTSGDFRSGNGVVWQSRTLTTPATSIPVALPWITGRPASLFWRVRAVGAGGAVSAWSQSGSFNMGTTYPREWRPQKGSYADRPGYVRWHAVDGATGYQVLFVNVHGADSDYWTKLIETITNVADEREYYAFHDASWTGDVDWRVRALRRVKGPGLGKTKNGLPPVSYGPWSPVYHWRNTYDALGTGPTVTPVAGVSDAISYKSQTRVHTLMPAFLFAGNGNTTTSLHRVYVFSDKSCVNVVYKGAVVGGPAYAPRTSGPLDLPKTDKEWFKAQVTVLKDGSEGEDVYAADTIRVRTSESPPLSETATGGTASSQDVGNHKVDLWDRGWPGGRYYWTVVPVQAVLVPNDDSEIPIDGASEDPTSFRVEYIETAVAQDQCHEGRGLDFGKQSVNPKPVDSRSVPYATGLAPTGRLLSAASKETQFYGPPLVSWDAAPAAVAYDVEWSRTTYPWRPKGRLRTSATSAVLPLAPGHWYYRVRGINDALPVIEAMTWSPPVSIRIAAPRFLLLHEIV